MPSPLSHHQHQTENGVYQVNFAFQGGNSVPVETRWGGTTHMKWKGCCTLQIRNLFCSRCTSCWMGFTLRGSASTCLIHSEKRKHFHHFTYCSCEGRRESFSSANTSVSSWAPRMSSLRSVTFICQDVQVQPHSQWWKILGQMRRNGEWVGVFDLPNTI